MHPRLGGPGVVTIEVQRLGQRGPHAQQAPINH
jgi:hypothetical protein